MKVEELVKLAPGSTVYYKSEPATVFCTCPQRDLFSFECRDLFSAECVVKIRLPGDVFLKLNVREALDLSLQKEPTLKYRTKYLDYCNKDQR